MPTTEETEQEVDEVESLEQEGISLRWANQRLHGANIGMCQRHENAMGDLEGRSDGEARAVLLRLAKESRTMNGELAAHLSRTSMLNLGVVEMLRKNRDGRAALMMRSAAEILVKGLANAEEEVCALKTCLKEVEEQRDSFKTLLAKTNSELTASQAYGQISNAVGEDSAATAASLTNKAAAAAAAAEGVVAIQPSAKGNPSGRQECVSSTGGGGGGGGGGSSNGDVSIVAVDGRSQSGFTSGVDQGSGKGNQRAETKKRQRGVGRGAGSAAAIPASATTTAAPAAAAAAASAGGKRKRANVAGVGGGAILAGDEGLGETNRQEQQRKGGEGGEGTRKGNGVDLPLSQLDPGRWNERWTDGGGVAGGGGGGDAGGDASDLHGVYDSDDAPSMFF